LDKRDLSGLSTEKLFDLFIKYSNVLKNAAAETILVKDKHEKGKALTASLFAKN
jgi:hypothetical protein